MNNEVTMPILPEEVRRPLEQVREQIHAALDRWRPGRRRREDEERDGEARSLARPVFSGPALDVEETDDAVVVRAELPERTRRVLELRFGLADGPPLTLGEIGRELGVSRERVRQLEAEGLRRLRLALRPLRPLLTDD